MSAQHTRTREPEPDRGAQAPSMIASLVAEGIPGMPSVGASYAALAAMTGSAAATLWVSAVTGSRERSAARTAAMVGLACWLASDAAWFSCAAWSVRRAGRGVIGNVCPKPIRRQTRR